MPEIMVDTKEKDSNVGDEVLATIGSLMSSRSIPSSTSLGR